MTPFSSTRPPLRRSHSWSLAEARAAAGLPPRWMAAAGETEFERLLREANIKLDDAHKFLMVTDWVRQFYRTKYVPPAVLEAMGIRAEEVV